MLALAFFLILAGCHKDSPLFGTWNSSVEVERVTGTSTVKFAADGQFTSTSHLQMKNAKVDVTDEGTWELSANRLKQVLVDTNWTFSGPSADRANARFRDRKAKIIEAANKDEYGMIAWHGNDFFTTTDSMGKTHDYHRVP